ncbi:hypothetical protein T484DRAFT_1757253 [Baffinella frigidus]|nr:hypothetical protein T484DRAFT_1757253 [Cryptophyta sp. CCMP2293]
MQTPDMGGRPPGVSVPVSPARVSWGDNNGVGKFVATLVPKDPIVQNPPMSNCWVTYGKTYCDPPIGRDWQIAFSDITDLSATMTVSNAPFNNGVSYLKWSSHQPQRPNKVNELLSGSYVTGGGTTFYMSATESAVQFYYGNYNVYTGVYEVPSATSQQQTPSTLDGVYFGETFTFTSPTCFTMTRSNMVSAVYSNTKVYSSPGLYEIYARNAETDPWTTIFQKTSIGGNDNNIYIGDSCYFQYGFTVSRTSKGMSDFARQLSFRKWQVYGQYRRPSQPLWRWSSPRVDYQLLPLFNAVNPVTSLWIPAGGVMVYPPAVLPTTYTVCRTMRSQHETTMLFTNWNITCVTNGRTDVSAHVCDQVEIGDGTDVLPYAFEGDKDYWIHSTYLWNIALSSAEMKIVTEGIRMELGGVPFRAVTPVIPVRELRSYKMRFLLALQPPFIMNLFSDFDGVSVPDRGKTGTHSVSLTGGVGKLVTEAGYGATNKVTSVLGDKDTQFLWEGGVTVPCISTTCWVSRSQGRNPLNRVGNVLASHDGKYAWGHGGEWYWGYVFHSSSATSNQQFVGTNPKAGGNPTATVGLYSGGPTASDWKVMCTASNGVVPTNIWMDQTPVGKMSGSGLNWNSYRYETQETINGRVYKTQYFGYPGGLNAPVHMRIGYTTSYNGDQPFGMHSMYVWDTILTQGQMRIVTEAIRADLGGTNEFESIPVAPMSSETAFCNKCPDGQGIDKFTGECLACPPGQVTSDGSECASRVVKSATATLSLPITVADFTPVMQEEFVSAIAVVVGVKRSQVQITSITAVPAVARRRLLSSEESVDVTAIITADVGNSLSSVESDDCKHQLVGKVVDFTGASSYAEAAIALEFDAITFMAYPYAASYSYSIDSMLILNFLGLSGTHYQHIRDMISDGSGFTVNQRDGDRHHTMTPSFGQDVLCPEVGDTTGITTGHVKCFWRRAIVANEVQPVAEESVYYYRNTGEDDKVKAKAWITETILGGNSGFAVSTASEYFDRVCSRNNDLQSAPRSYGCLFIDPGYNWISRLRGSRLASSPFMISDKTIVVAILTISDGSGTAVRRRLLSSDSMGVTDTLDLPDAAMDTLDLPDAAMDTLDLPDAAMDTLDLPDAAMDTLDLQDAAMDTLDLQDAAMDTLDLQDAAMDTLRDTESVVYNSRHLLQANSAVDVTSPFGNSAVEASNTGVRAALNIIYMSGFEKNRVQLMQIYALRLKRVPLDVYAGNINKLMFALGPAGSLGKLVHSLEPVGFESTPMLPPTNLALLQDDDPFVGTNITALLRMDSVFGDVYVNVLQCVLLKVANHTGLLTTEEVAQVLSKCETHVMSLGTREGVVMYLSTCAVSMEEMDTLHCNKLQGRLDLLPDLPAVEWGSVSDNETALYFQIHFDTLYREFAIDAVYDSYVRATVADILAVSVARVVHRPHLSEPETRARRLLQTNEATTSDVWVYPGSYVDPEDLLILFREQDAPV